MNKKYSVFVSSTYEDLKDERQEVVNALLKMDCFPVGMEYFNASDKSQWEVIKSLIDECDYYILIIAGRYGSVEPTSGKSYTQKEFEYAKSKGVPTIAFIHEHPENLPDKFTEKDNKDKLAQFREEAKNSLVCLWNSKGDLTKDVVLSLIGEFKSHPRVGWMRADEKSSNEQNKEILRLREENEALQAKIKNMEENAPEGTEDLCQGEDKVKLYFGAEVDDDDYYDDDLTIELTWNEICKSILPHLVQRDWGHNMDTYIEEYIKSIEPQYSRVSLRDESLQTIKVQLIALGLIEAAEMPKNRQNTAEVWQLTKYGRLTLMRLRAMRKVGNESLKDNNYRK